MAHKKGLGSSKNGRDSNSQRLGIKAYGGQIISSGAIIMRQRGTKFTPGENVGEGRDNTLFACVTGAVKYGFSRGKRFVSVLPLVKESST